VPILNLSHPDVSFVLDFCLDFNNNACCQILRRVNDITYEDYLALREQLDDLRATRRPDPAYAEYLRNPSSARPYSEIRADLVAEGLLDEAV